MNDQLLQTTSENLVPAACYARNAQLNPESIKAQVRACRAYAEAHGLSIADEHVFVDDGASGANFDRPGWQALQRSGAADDPPFACVIVTEPSRVSRSADPTAHPTTLAEGRVSIRYVTGAGRR
jgi:DNA invertase Pin-like site-specific DNA recombinase